MKCMYAMAEELRWDSDSRCSSKGGEFSRPTHDLQGQGSQRKTALFSYSYDVRKKKGQQGYFQRHFCVYGGNINSNRLRMKMEQDHKAQKVSPWRSLATDGQQLAHSKPSSAFVLM